MAAGRSANTFITFYSILDRIAGPSEEYNNHPNACKTLRFLSISGIPAVRARPERAGRITSRKVMKVIKVIKEIRVIK